MFVEAESGLAAQIGLADTEIDILHPRVMPLDAFFKPNPDSDSRTPFGLNIFDLYKDLYEREFKFVPRHDRHVALFENGPSDDDAFTEAAFGGFPKSGALEPLPKHVWMPLTRRNSYRRPQIGPESSKTASASHCISRGVA